MERPLQVGLMSTRVLGKMIYRDLQSSTFVEFYSIPYELMELNKVISKRALLSCQPRSRREASLGHHDYADDMAMLDISKEGLQETTDLLCHVS